MSYHLTSTMIDDEELIEELKKYDEHITVTGSQTGSKKKGAAAAAAAGGPLLTDRNREIYLKKLNHYKAREKVESNPSKQYLKQKQQHADTSTSGVGGGKSTPRKSSGRRGAEHTNGHDVSGAAAAAAADEDDDDDDVIDITDSKNDGSGYYVQMANAQTSPLSTTYFEHSQAAANDNQSDIIYTSTVSPAPYQPSTASQPLKDTLSKSPVNASNKRVALRADQTDLCRLDYVSLKEKIELEKTLSKYRSDINNILNNSKVSNRVGASPSSTRQHQNDENSAPGARDVGVDHYCPRPAKTSSQLNRSIFDVFKPSTYLRSHDSRRDESSNGEISSAYSQLREVRGSANWRGHKDTATATAASASKPSESKSEYLIPVKETPSSLANFYQNQLKPFVTNFGLQLSKLLPYLVIIIFTIIILQYVRMKFQSKPGDAETAGDSLYSGGESWFGRPIVDDTATLSAHFCADIKDTKCSQTKLVLRELIDYLRARSGVVDCTAAYSDRSTRAAADGRLSANFIEKCVHLNEIVDFLMNKQGLFPKKLQTEAVDSVLKAIARNPHWDVHLLNEAYGETSNPLDVVYLMSTISSKPVKCRLGEALQLLYIRGLMVFSAVVVIVLGYLAVTLYNRQRNENNKIFYNLVSQVVAMVEKQYELSMCDPTGAVKPYVAISHIYDTLVEPSQRAHQKGLWNKVIKFIADHESRIHLETQFIDGEETHAWKWIVAKPDASLVGGAYKYARKEGIGLANSTMINGDSTPFLHHHHHHHLHAGMNDENADLTGAAAAAAANPVPSIYPQLPSGQASPANGWQGDAFSKSERSFFSPTPCLKIRNMFDQAQIEQDAQFALKIHNAILEKCSVPVAPHGKPANTGILHIACDKKSKEGCVYVKCASNDAAGRAYQALNGTWYNGKLLNVKYLRSDRYLERFPESIAFNTPLQRL